MAEIDRPRIRALAGYIRNGADSIKMSGNVINNGFKHEEEEIRGEISRIEDHLNEIETYLGVIKRLLNPSEVIESSNSSNGRLGGNQWQKF